MKRRLPIGAEPVRGGVHFRVWAPHARSVDVVLARSGERVALAAEGNGYFSGLAAGARPGDLYGFSLDGGDARPDPASRFQPDGPHGLSQVIDPGAFRWTDGGWRGLPAERPVLYETHIGTLTPAGTWNAAAAVLPDLEDVGISGLEVMPVAAFPGRFGWGYDGVDLFAPTQLYGTPDDFRAFVDAAHAHGLAVILDVVYNHVGPDGSCHREFSPHYFSREYRTDWGEALNYDGELNAPVREFVLSNARHWIEEYHLDGLRLDATQSLFDRSEPHIVADIARVVHSAAAGRRVLVVAENESQDAALLRPADAGGMGVDAAWNDDFHHSARVALTRRAEAYYSDYRGTPQELLSAVRRGYLYQGQHYRWQGRRRGTAALDVEVGSFVNFLQNHDQVANSAYGQRIHELTSPGLLRSLTALLLLAPGIPMLLQGQEFAASSPFLYFADHRPKLAKQVARGRHDFLKQFPGIATSAVQQRLARPDDEATFRQCVLDWTERARHGHVLRLHRDLIALSRTAPFLHATRASTDGAVLGAECLLLRFFDEPHDDRLLLVNLGLDLELSPAPEPLLAPPAGRRWRLAWSSEQPEYGGGGAPDDVESETGWRIPGWTAVVLRPAPNLEPREP